MIPIAGCILLLGAALLTREGWAPSFSSMDEKDSRSPIAFPSTDNRISLSENPQEVRTDSHKMPDAVHEPAEIADFSSNDPSQPVQGAVKHAHTPSIPRAKRQMASDVLPDDSDEVSANLEDAELAGVEPEAPVSYQLPAVRLADDVQLPAVILTLNEEQIDPENKTPQPIKDAMKSIVDKFYTNIAESAAEGDYVSKDPDGTLVVGKGPGVERAREEADQIYRALFGEEAYNRMTMDSLLESQLPVVDSSVGEQDTSPAQP